MENAVARLGRAGVASGWRAAVADRVVPPLARRTRARDETVRAAIGILFIAVSAYYLGRSLRDAAVASGAS